jgi:tRNA (uracil-5-)-methyltransferase TRM9
MDAQTALFLVEINRKFYSTFANQFSATRQRLQPGVKAILQQIPSKASILDLGCGNGELARTLAQRGHTGLYAGLDFSPELLLEARQSVPATFPAQFFTADLASSDWDKSFSSTQFDVGLVFAVLHHLPGERLRLDVLEKLHRCLIPGAKLYISNWQFLNSPRWVARIQPWDKVHLTSAAVDPGDYLLDWRRGGYGLRYVHHFSSDELYDLAQKTGFRVIDEFQSDGEGNKLGTYQTWQVVPNFNH